MKFDVTKKNGEGNNFVKATLLGCINNTNPETITIISKLLHNVGLAVTEEIIQSHDGLYGFVTKLFSHPDEIVKLLTPPPNPLELALLL